MFSNHIHYAKHFYKACSKVGIEDIINRIILAMIITYMHKVVLG